MDAIDFHNSIASVWDKKYERGLFRQRARDVACAVKEHAIEGQTWIDAGCGTGYLSARMAEMGLRVHGVDASPAMVEAASRIVSSSRASFAVCKSIDELPFDGMSVDGILCSSVLEYMNDPLTALSEFHRILRPGGLLVVTVPNAMNYMLNAQKIAYRVTSGLGLTPWPMHLPLSIHHYRPKGLRDFLAKAQFDPISVSYTSSLPAIAKLGINSGLLLSVARRG